MSCYPVCEIIQRVAYLTELVCVGTWPSQLTSVRCASL